MANYNEVARTNYFKVADLEGLTESLAPFPISIHTNTDDDEHVCLLGEDPNGAGWPVVALDDNGDDIVFNPALRICPFIAKNEVVVIMGAGHEKQRYVRGWAIAYNDKGKMVSIDLDDIYAVAAKAFMVPLKSITRATY